MKKLEELEKELEKLEARLLHMAREYAETRGGSAYGVEYYEIQVKVYQAMIIDVKKEIQKEKLKLKV
jgi:hypothetical protein